MSVRGAFVFTIACMMLTACGRSSGTRAAAVATAGAPANWPVADVRGAAALDDAQRDDVRRTVAAQPPAIRARLRCALVPVPGGKATLVVYDPGPAVAHRSSYVVPRVLNATDGSHYDPRQNEIVEPLR